MTYAVGDALPERGFGPVTMTDIVRYQGASGDFNPIHHDDAFARSAGFPGVFSVGMLQAGYLATYVTDIFGPTNVRKFGVRFVEQVWPGDALTCTGRVAGLSSENPEGEKRLALEVSMTRRSGGQAVLGWAEFAV
jgi:acyl dehydratase